MPLQPRDVLLTQGHRTQPVQRNRHPFTILELASNVIAGLKMLSGMLKLILASATLPSSIRQ